MALSKLEIMGIVAGVGTFLAMIAGIARGFLPGVVIEILTLFGCLIFYFLYQPPAGQACEPDKADSNVATWVTNAYGACEASTCASGYYIVPDKFGIQRCIVPTDLPPRWSNATTSNVVADTTSNLISTFKTIDTMAECGYECFDTDGCNVAAYDPTAKLCSLFTAAPLTDKTKPTPTPPTMLITRPGKTS